VVRVQICLRDAQDAPANSEGRWEMSDGAGKVASSDSRIFTWDFLVSVGGMREIAGVFIYFETRATTADTTRLISTQYPSFKWRPQTDPRLRFFFDSHHSHAATAVVSFRHDEPLNGVRRTDT